MIHKRKKRPIFSSAVILFLCFFKPILEYGQPKNSGADTLQVNQKSIPAQAFVLPTAMVAYGFVAINNKSFRKLDHDIKTRINEKHPNFHNSIDNYAQVLPAASVFALDAFRLQGKHQPREQAVIYGTSVAITSAFIFPIKKLTQIERPDQSTYNSFPSGHTALAFASAEFLMQEYKNTSPWIGIAGYAIATTTGVLRMYNNRHWLSDVIAGAGFGIASTKLSYLLYEKVYRKKGWNFTLSPIYSRENIGLYFVHNF